jgi:Na+-transporting NADH:ubiquinone oxidoreductase subunit A
MKHFNITKGLDLKLAGEPDQTKAPERKDVRRAAVTGADYVGLKPTILVEAGEKVLAGQPLVEDKRNPGVKLVAPIAGTVAKIARGEKRAFQSIVVEADEGAPTERSLSFKKYADAELDGLEPDVVRDLLVGSGLWASLRARPFSIVPRINATPAALFVNAADTNPHAPDPKPIIEARKDAFINGLRILGKICGKKLWVCFGKGEYDPNFIQEIESIPLTEAAQFTGKHPSGLVGTHIFHLEPCSLKNVVWSIGYQDVIAVADLFSTGLYPSERIISLSGPLVKNPRLLRVTQGAFVTELVDGELEGTDLRVISGSVLHGRTIAKDREGLGRYVNQVSVVGDGDPRKFLAWTTPNFKTFSVSRTAASTWFPLPNYKMTTAVGGGYRAIFPNPEFKRLMPLDLEPTSLFKALAMGDIDRSEELGAYELDEEDLALCTLVDYGKNDFGKMLRELLNKAMKEEV